MFRKQFAGLGSQAKDRSPGKSSSSQSGDSNSAHQPAAASEPRRPEGEEELTRRLAQHHLGEEKAVAKATAAAFLLPENTEQSIIAGNLASFVRLPKFICREEWIASHVFEFFHLVNAFYESVAEHCTARTCGPLLLDLGKRQLRAYWGPELCNQLALSVPLVSTFSPLPDHEDSGSGSGAATAVQSASAFIDYALTWIDQQLEDPQRFPNRLGNRDRVCVWDQNTNDDGDGGAGGAPRMVAKLSAPPSSSGGVEGVIGGDFERTTAGPIFSLLFVIIYHIYQNHFGTVVELGQVAHLNGLFAHFFCFTQEFSLIAPQDRQLLVDLSTALLKRVSVSEG